MKLTQRTIRRIALNGSALACVAALSACIVEPARPPRPEPIVEVVPATPAPGYHWVKGIIDGKATIGRGPMVIGRRADSRAATTAYLKKI
jgi:hypothetical protein